jgi:hypothetical protein
MQTLPAPALRPFHVRLFSDIHVEFADLFLHAINKAQAKCLAIKDMKAQDEIGQWDVIKITCTENL